MADLVKLLKALSSEPRLKIFRLLKEKPLCVNALTARLEMTQSAVSQHLRVLKEAGLVKAQKRGYWAHYSVDPDAVKKCGKSVGKLFEVAE